MVTSEINVKSVNSVFQYTIREPECSLHFDYTLGLPRHYDVMFNW